MEQKIEEQKELLLVRQRELNSISIDNDKNEKLLKKLQRKRKLLSDSIEKQRQSIYYKKRKLVNLNETLTVWILFKKDTRNWLSAYQVKK